MVSVDNELISISDLFGNHKLLKQGKPVSERATLIGFFADTVQKPARIIGIRLAHYSLDDLYALQSCVKDRIVRNSQETAEKYFWAVTRTLSTG